MSRLVGRFLVLANAGGGSALHSPAFAFERGASIQGSALSNSSNGFAFRSVFLDARWCD